MLSFRNFDRNCISRLFFFIFPAKKKLNNENQLESNRNEKKNIFTSKISNPAISNTPMKYDRRSLVSKALFTRWTIHQNIRSKMALDRPQTVYNTWLTFCPLLTNSVPTLTLGLIKDLWNSPTGIPNK